MSVIDRLHGVEGMLQVIAEASESDGGDCITNAIVATLDYLRDIVKQIETEQIATG